MIGNESKSLLKTLIEGLDRSAISLQLINIFKWWVKPQAKVLFLDKQCQKATGDSEKNPSENENNCSEYECDLGYLSLLDKLVVETGFKIFLIFQRLEDMLGSDPNIESTDGKEDEDGYDTEMSQKERIEVSEVIVEPGKRKEQHLYTLTTLFNPKKMMRKDSPELPTRDLNRRATKKNTISPFVPRFPSQRNLKEPSTREGMKPTSKKGNQDTVEIQESGKKLLGEARQFFSSYVASLEVLHEGNLVQVHFQIPYFCRHITKEIKKDIIWNANRSSDQERLEKFFSNIRNYEYQMKRRQNLASRPILYFIVRNYTRFLAVNFLLILIINIGILMGNFHPSSRSIDQNQNIIERVDSSKITKNAIITTPLLIVQIIQVLFCFLLLLVGLYDAECRTVPSSKMLSHVWKLAKNQSTWWGVALLVLSIIGLSGVDLLYQVVLILDLFRASRLLRRSLATAASKMFIIGLTVLFILILVYFYGIFAFDQIPSVLDRVSSYNSGSHR